ncbi:hypothetical protein [Pseudomonas sp. NA-150]|uniref:hypothetical protein n=1 Tax=Pseudomonas sp. NA-150 TaxID=3367525 RepID=UPI0037C9A974
MLQVFLVHGFRSHCINMLSFYEAYKKDKIHFKSNVHAHNWDAGTIIQSKFDTVFEVLSKGLRGHADEVMDQWSAAVDRIDDTAQVLVKTINDSVPQGGDALLVAHSMGTEVVLQAISHIRKDIDIYLFFMAGIANSLVYEDLIEHDARIRLVYNYYSDSDLILERYLPEIGICFYDPIGMFEIDGKKVSNVNIKCGHSGYFSSRPVLNKYTELVTQLVNKTPGTYMRFTS